MDHQFFQVVTVVSKVNGKVIEKVLAPGFRSHHIHGVNNSVPHKAIPHTVCNGSGEAAIVWMGYQNSELF